MGKENHYKAKLVNPEKVFEDTLSKKGKVKVDIAKPTRLNLEGLGKPSDKEKKKALTSRDTLNKDLPTTAEAAIQN